MAFHIPFNQRASAQPRPEPIYIGFEPPRYVAPRRQRRPVNWCGFHGMWMAFASLLTAGFLSPIPLLISLIGLRRPGKKMATVGTIVSLGGMLMASTIVFSGVAAHHQHEFARNANRQRRIELKQIAETRHLLNSAVADIVEYRDTNDGYLPEDVEGNMLVIKHIDPWGESLRFEPESDRGIVRSAGPDSQFLTNDDLFVSIDGNTERQPLLPITE